MSVPSATGLRRKRGSASRALKKLINAVHDLESGRPDKLDVGEVTAKIQLLEKTELTFGQHHQDLLEVVEEEDIVEKDETIADEFADQAQDLHGRLVTLQNIAIAYDKLKVLTDALQLWEECRSSTDSDTAVPMPQLEQAYEDFTKSVYTPGAKSSGELQDALKSTYIKLLHYKKSIGIVSPVSPSSSISCIDHASVAVHSLRPPPLPLPTFHGDYMEWPSFMSRFKEMMKKFSISKEEDKVSYLKDAIKSKDALELVKTEIRSQSYEGMLRKLDGMYNRPRKTFRQTVKRLLPSKMPSDMHKAAEAFRSGFLEAAHQVSHSDFGQLPQLLTAMAELAMGETLFEEWKRHTASAKKVPDFTELDSFIDQCQMLSEPSDDSHDKRLQHSQVPSLQPVKRTQRAVMVTKTVRVCPICSKGNHGVSQCDFLLSLAPADRKVRVKRSRLCYNCLSSFHMLDACQSRHTCRICQNRHHTLLHVDIPNRSSQSVSSSVSVKLPPDTSMVKPPAETCTVKLPPEASTVNAIRSNSSASLGENSIFPTFRVLVKGSGGMVSARGFIDTGAAMSCISSRLASTIKAKKKRQTTFIVPFGADGSSRCDVIASVELQPTSGDTSLIPLKMVVVEKILDNLPSAPIEGVKDLPCLSGLQLADPDFYRPGRVDLLIGLDSMSLLNMRTLGLTTPKGLMIASSKLHHLVFGVPPQFSNNSHAPIYSISVISPSAGLDLTRFWELEELPSSTSGLSLEDQQAVNHFENSHTRNEDGRYVVSLPWKTLPPQLGESREQAYRRLLTNERSLQRKGRLKQFQDAIHEYLELNHAELVPADELSNPSYYMPSHGIVKESSSTTKFRIVFDASARSSTGNSLNDCLLPGPCCYPRISDLYLKFRKHRVALIADVSKMFREVELGSHDKDFHRFLIRDRTSNEVIDARMKRLSFGVTSSPFLATSVLQQVAKDHSAEFVRASQVVLHEFYVDDVLTGSDTVQEAISIRSELCALLGKAQMNLRKWRSNSDEVMSTIPESLREVTPEVHLLNPSSHPKALGIHWKTTDDSLHVAVPSIPAREVVTKRTVTSDVAQVYDVLGLLAPVTFFAKCLIQNLWQANIGWDEPLPPTICSNWQKWQDDLPTLAELCVSRCYFKPNRQVISCELHGFCDASRRGYAATIYVRVVYTDSSVDVVLVYSRTKVSPIKQLTIPRLELCGAALLAETLKYVSTQLSIPLETSFAWTDSSIVLSWIQTSPSKLKTFEANRVSKILQHLHPGRWRHVPSQYNPADIASRGLLPGQLLAADLWWKGPPWLSAPPTFWPEGRPKACKNIPGLKSHPVFAIQVFEDITTRCSSYNRLLKVMSWVKRFIENSRKPKDCRSLQALLTVEDIEGAEVTILRSHQLLHFSEEVECLSKGQQVSRSSHIKAYNPLLDKQGLITVGGRLNQSSLPTLQKHPVLIRGSTHLARLLIRHEHLRSRHSGQTTVMGLLSQRFLLTGARKAVRSVLRSCVPCAKLYARTLQQSMGQLPKERITPSHFFATIGIDFAGPITTKYGHVRKPTILKSYIALFICYSTRAIHLEAVSDLSAEGFVAALRRFVARRGLPETIWTDNGSNFAATDADLKAAYDMLNKPNVKQTVSNFLTDRRVTWKRIPARSPNFGGIWETAVRSAKRLLHKSTMGLKLTFEELSTTLAEIEAILNSRPYLPLDATDTDGNEALTPAHFLLGKTPLALPTTLHTRKSSTSTRRWNLLQKTITEYWKEWTKSYLVSLNRYSKWTIPKLNLGVGDVVVCKDSPEWSNRKWPLARVVKVHPGEDGIVRVVTIRIGKKEFQRPVRKLVKLVEEYSDASFDTSEETKKLSHASASDSCEVIQSSAPPPQNGYASGTKEEGERAVACLERSELAGQLQLLRNSPG